MLRAASLVYAIFISLLIGVLCYMLLLIYSLNMNIENHLYQKDMLMLQNQSAQAYVNSKQIDLKGLAFEDYMSETPNITSSFDSWGWGLFNILKIKTYSNRDSISQYFLLANRRSKKAPALYLRDNDEDFKVSGNTLITGDIYISGTGVKRIPIEGKSENKLTHNGNVFKSDKAFPQIKDFNLVYPEDYELILLNDIPSSYYFNSFQNRTKVIEVQNILEHIDLKGNFIVRSRDTIEIASTATLKDIIIEAPKVIIKSGFTGNLQIFSGKEIILEPDAKLNFPSLLIVNSDKNYENLIFIDENASVSGHILITGNSLGEESKNRMVINKGALITGDIYCNGVLSLYGKVKGSVFASAIQHKTNVTNYKNLIIDGDINSDALPKDFFQLNIIDDFHSESSIFLKKL